GVAGYAVFCRFLSLNAARLRMSVPPERRSLRFVFSAAGFIATSTSGWSPGVRMSWSAKWIWKPDTPGSEPAGARISAGKSGSVERSLPNSAVSLVNQEPVSCMPSPESPAKRITTRSMRSTGFVAICGQRSAAVSPRKNASARRAMLGSMTRLSDLMQRDVLGVAPEDTLGFAAEQMAERGVGAAVVVDYGRLIGILSERDILRAVAGRVHSSEARVRDWMTADPVT